MWFYWKANCIPSMAALIVSVVLIQLGVFV